MTILKVLLKFCNIQVLPHASQTWFYLAIENVFGANVCVHFPNHVPSRCNAFYIFGQPESTVIETNTRGRNIPQGHEAMLHRMRSLHILSPHLIFTVRGVSPDVSLSVKISNKSCCRKPSKRCFFLASVAKSNIRTLGLKTGVFWHSPSGYATRARAKKHTVFRPRYEITIFCGWQK